MRLISTPSRRPPFRSNRSSSAGERTSLRPLGRALEAGGEVPVMPDRVLFTRVADCPASVSIPGRCSWKAGAKWRLFVPPELAEGLKAARAVGHPRRLAAGLRPRINPCDRGGGPGRVANRGSGHHGPLDLASNRCRAFAQPRLSMRFPACRRNVGCRKATLLLRVKQWSRNGNSVPRAQDSQSQGTPNACLLLRVDQSKRGRIAFDELGARRPRQHRQRS